MAHSVLLLLLLAVSVEAHCPTLPGRGASVGAARCVYLGRSCDRLNAGHVCFTQTSAYRQSWLCRHHACAFCKCHPGHWPCRKPMFLKACLFTTGTPLDAVFWGTPAPVPPKVYNPGRRAPKKYKARYKTKPKMKSVYKPKPKSTSIPRKRPRTVVKKPKYAPKPRRIPRARRSSRGCVFRGRYGHVVIPAPSGRYRYPWVRHGMCLVWKPNKSGASIDRPGSGEICYRFRVDKSSTYYLTADTRAPHVTEHNDLWILFNRGLRLYKVESNRYWKWGKYYFNWLKGYQNLGGMKYANMLRTIDFNGHQFETSYLRRGETYKVCISGRSSKYYVCNLHLVACKGKWCRNSSKAIQAILKRTTSSPCY